MDREPRREAGKQKVTSRGNDKDGATKEKAKGDGVNKKGNDCESV